MRDDHAAAAQTITTSISGQENQTAGIGSINIDVDLVKITFVKHYKMKRVEDNLQAYHVKSVLEALHN